MKNCDQRCSDHSGMEVSLGMANKSIDELKIDMKDVKGRTTTILIALVISCILMVIQISIGVVAKGNKPSSGIAIAMERK